MVRIEILEKEGKISRIRETELNRYIEFFTESYQDNLKHSEANIGTYPRWSIMHENRKLWMKRSEIQSIFFSKRVFYFRHPENSTTLTPLRFVQNLLALRARVGFS